MERHVKIPDIGDMEAYFWKKQLLSYSAFFFLKKYLGFEIV